MIKLSKQSKLYLMITLVLSGIILVYICNNPTEIEESVYTFNEETRIKNMIETLDGVSEVSVLLTYSQTNTTLSESEASVIGDIKGVAISAVGADDPVVSEKIKSLICAAYDINDHMIFVCGK